MSVAQKKYGLAASVLGAMARRRINDAGKQLNSAHTLCREIIRMRLHGGIAREWRPQRGGIIVIINLAYYHQAGVMLYH